MGELDQVVVNRESDIGNGFKYHGWHNPLADADEGEDDERVLWITNIQFKTKTCLLKPN